MGRKCPSAEHVQLRAQHTPLTWACLHPALDPQRTLGEEEPAGIPAQLLPKLEHGLCEQGTWDSGLFTRPLPFQESRYPSGALHPGPSLSIFSR